MYMYISRVSDQNGVSHLYNMLEIYHSGPEPLIYMFDYRGFPTRMAYLKHDM